MAITAISGLSPQRQQIYISPHHYPEGWWMFCLFSYMISPPFNFIESFLTNINPNVIKRERAGGREMRVGAEVYLLTINIIFLWSSHRKFPGFMWSNRTSTVLNKKTKISVMWWDRQRWGAGGVTLLFTPAISCYGWPAARRPQGP